MDKVPEDIYYDRIEDRQDLARKINEIIDRQFSGQITLSSSSGNITDDRITDDSIVTLTPTTSQSGYYVTVSNGSATVFGTSGAVFNYLVFNE